MSSNIKTRNTSKRKSVKKWILLGLLLISLLIIWAFFNIVFYRVIEHLISSPEMPYLGSIFIKISYYMISVSSMILPIPYIIRAREQEESLLKTLYHLLLFMLALSVPNGFAYLIIILDQLG